jgi:hypothetical protein
MTVTDGKIAPGRFFRHDKKEEKEEEIALDRHADAWAMTLLQRHLEQTDDDDTETFSMESVFSGLFGKEPRHPPDKEA